ncbi:hypothetical protein HPB51_009509 [Rhipicephalus microplus]|uniref:Uncharacterized protein n=1 Tax=Rhipicephalus microplus TaxID=6941 RepID=A0A9J6DUP9_RHIMP|nr:hypothetical protein HPB51_009509 [Rhipicephalus microplus]
MISRFVALFEFQGGCQDRDDTAQDEQVTLVDELQVQVRSVQKDLVFAVLGRAGTTRHRLATGSATHEDVCVQAQHPERVLLLDDSTREERFRKSWPQARRGCRTSPNSCAPPSSVSAAATPWRSA